MNRHKAGAEGISPRKQYETTRSPARVLQVIYELATSTNGLSLARLASLTHLPKTSLLTLLRSLEAANYVVNVSGMYQLGTETYAIAAAITAKERFLPTARPALQALFADTGETVQIGILVQDEALAETIEMIETRKPVRFSMAIGLRRPLHSSSIGKLLLAHQPVEWTRTYLKHHELEAFTPQTITSEVDLLAELERIRQNGISISHESMFEGMSGISAPIWNEAGYMLAGISVTGPTYRLRPEESRIRELAQRTGEDISRKLGYAGPYPRKETNDAVTT
ncbi:bacterial transcriptional regulator family protein [Paraburkholderia xenovorans LB400]|uniref:Transcriptional regulator, IclR family n=1 Tax=Paraburkholderia xenovorans (strain LB400) TaxID=266265 RepID=Q13PF5_PARXL|nr:IclR family transcriptional regulator [Paraburkholderia xenovorans]ABE34034.1 transcriptional regulator, IclR family [Paraburkholderia xenovorans LB400]AIP37649.1 bacterial transcriptional regulator family protein [Paraburkholderia xenovorans LB400]